MMTTIAIVTFTSVMKLRYVCFVSGVIVARRSRVFDLTVIGHYRLSKLATRTAARLSVIAFAEQPDAALRRQFRLPVMMRA